MRGVKSPLPVIARRIREIAPGRREAFVRDQTTDDAAFGAVCEWLDAYSPRWRDGLAPRVRRSRSG